MSDRVSGQEKLETEYNVSRETLSKLGIYEDELLRWNAKINLIAPSTAKEIWHRHFIDSIQLAKYAAQNTQNWLDLGSGAGFPGLVLAAHMGGTSFTLVESDQRKCAFLRKVAREMGINAEIINERIENIGPRKADVISARALASLDELLDYSFPYSKKTTSFIFPKGKNWQSELAKAQESWTMNVESHKSHTDSEAAILIITGLERNG